MGHLVNNRQIEQLPLNGRDVLQLATLQNGVISTSSTTDTQSNLGLGTTRLTINGGRLDFNAFLLDGTETADAIGYSPGGLGGGFLGGDALREFQILTSNYSAEFGHGGRAVINAVTKSGTNQIHGTAFEFLRHSALDARNPFDLPNPGQQLLFQRNQFGGSLGGPIIKDRAFLFGSYEGLRRREGVPRLYNVPSPDARQRLLVDPTKPGADPNDPTMKQQIFGDFADAVSTGDIEPDALRAVGCLWGTISERLQRADLHTTGKDCCPGSVQRRAADRLPMESQHAVGPGARHGTERGLCGILRDTPGDQILGQRADRLPAHQRAEVLPGTTERPEDARYDGDRSGPN
jgi:hypothetical protein